MAFCSEPWYTKVNAWNTYQTDTEETENGHAISILECGSDGEIDINTDALTQIFRQQEIQNIPISIVSIAGEFRGGKSFLSNFFLRYLRNKGYARRNWMGSAYKPLKEGFDWRGGRKACTNGIMIWSEVFYVTKNDKKIAIMLMDTQGLFDNQSDNKTNSIIFAFSTLISSVQIFNLSKQIKQSDLELLQFFTGYAEAASHTSPAHHVKPFQTLFFLVRDWQFPYELQYGMSGGRRYIEEIIREKSSNKEQESVKNCLDSSFSDIRCFLMPHPGKKVAEQTTFDGCLKDIDDEFLDHTVSLVEILFNPENIVTKNINGQEVYASTILSYITDCSKNIEAGKLPNPGSMMQNVTEAHNIQVQQMCFENYMQTMEEILCEEFIQDDQLLREIHEKTKISCLRKYNEQTTFGEEGCRKKHCDLLEKKIAKEYEALVQRSRSKKVEAEVKALRGIYSAEEDCADSMEQTNMDSYDQEIQERKQLYRFRCGEVETRINKDHSTGHLGELMGDLYLNDKEQLEDIFETLRTRESMEYESIFQELLEDNYMTETDLIRCHDEVVNALLNNLRRQIGSDISGKPIGVNHMIKTETVLQSKFFEIKVWNKR